MSKTTEMENALKVIILDPKIRKWLSVNDPAALEQAGKQGSRYSCSQNC